MSKIDYDFYSCQYEGNTIPREVFGQFLRRGEILLANMVRYDTAPGNSDEIGFLLCEICDRLYQEDRHRDVSRESLDGYDVTYCNEVEHDIAQLVRRHLGDSGMLYRGRHS
ncbi:MAG: hypothetical protein E7393_04860 [Ruminococcaceae bacterium]|nr:hypothetical protein [Oscillospiraceae bacterium]